MNGREIRQRAQTAQEMTEEIDRAADVEAGLVSSDGGNVSIEGRAPFGGENASVGGSLSFGEGSGMVSPDAGLSTSGGLISAERARGIAGVAMGQVLTYNPDAVKSGQTQGDGQDFGGGRSGERIVGRNTHEMMGVAGKSLFELENPSMHEKAENERAIEIANVDNGYASKETDPNLSSVENESRLEKEEWSRDDRINLQGELNPQASFDSRTQNEGQEKLGEVMASEVGALLRQDNVEVDKIVALWFEGMQTMLKRFKVPRIFGARNNN